LHRALSKQALIFAASSFLCTAPAGAIESVVRGAIAEADFGSGGAGYTLMGELGGEWAGIQSDKPGRWLVDWDLLGAFRGGILVNTPQPVGLLGLHLAGWAQGGLRTTVESPWSPYIGGRLGGNLLVMAQPGVALSALNTVNNMTGVGGVVGVGVVGVEVGASMLEAARSLRLVVVVQESLHSQQTYTPAFAFTDIGLAARFDAAESITTYLAVVIGAAPARNNAALDYTDQTFHGRLDFGFRKIFNKGMWLDTALTVERYFDQIVYPHGASYTTGDAFILGVGVSFGFAFWEKPT